MANRTPITDEDLAMLKELMEQATPPPMNWGKPEEVETAEQAVEFCASVIRQSEGTSLWGVFTEGEDGRTLAFTGNGPTSEVNARYLANLWSAAPFLFELIEEQRERLRTLGEERERTRFYTSVPAWMKSGRHG